MCFLDLITMSKRLKYFISSVISAFGFFLYMSIPVDSRYFGLMAGVVLVIFCFWFGLDLIFSDDFNTRMMAIILPVLFFVGFGLFSVLLPDSWWIQVLLSVVFGMMIYFMFLVENVFIVAIGYRTVPLYRAAYTVSLMMLLGTCFFIFNSMLSFKLYFWMNMLITLAVSVLFFIYHFWSVTIELSDDGKGFPKGAYVMVPSLLMAELSAILSFWPTGIFKGSVYLVTFIYILGGLIQANLRGRLFRRSWVQFLYIGLASIGAMLLATSWKN